jgi:predicted alpha-1,2-mannosidase
MLIKRLFLILLASVVCFSSVSAQEQEQERPVDLVYPHLDTANSRWFYFDSASLPFGMVNLSPDTEVAGAWGSGYLYNTEEVKGLSHVHAWQLAGVSVMPISSDQSTVNLQTDYYSGFSHDTEIVRPGYHRLWLDRYDIEVELTATTRVGFHRYTFPENRARKVLLNLSGNLGPSEMIEGHAEQIGLREVSGYVVNGPTFRRPKATRIYFHISLDTDIEQWSGWLGDQEVSDNPVSGSNAAVILNLGKQSGQSTVGMKVGLSYTSAENAQRNLSAELDHWEFDQVAEDAQSVWNTELSKIQVSGGTEQQRARFYTDLWHAQQGRRIVSDFDGSYLDMTGETPRIRQPALLDSGQPENHHYNSDSFWGAQWTIQTLWPLAYPSRTSDFIKSFLNYYRDGGLFPRGPSGGNYTYVMVGASSTPFVVSAWQKGIQDFNGALAYQAVRKNHLPGGIMEHAGYEHGQTGAGALTEYMEKGYIPFPPTSTSRAFHKQGAGMTLEYAYQDWALAQFADVLGNESDVQLFRQRSENWRNMFDVETAYMRPKNSDGQWRQEFDPFEINAGFVESNASQATWYVPHNIPALAELMGSCDAAADKLNASFQEAAKLGFTSGTSHAQETNPEFRRIPINYGNQPSIQTAFIFNELGKPWLTQYWSREIVNSVYAGLSPERGYNGDEDQGLMGANAVLMKIGLYQMDGGVSENPVYQIGSPIFDEIEIHLDDNYYQGDSFLLRTINNSTTNKYIERIELNGTAIQRSYLRHSEIVNGGELTLFMTDEPNTAQTNLDAGPNSCRAR